MSPESIPIRRRTFRRRKGKYFVAGGIGRYGPYILGTLRTTKRTSVKISAGTRGVIASGKYRGKRYSASVGYNLITKRPEIKIKKRRRRRRRAK